MNNDFKDIEGFSNYAISTDGVVISKEKYVKTRWASLSKRDVRVMKLKIDRYGYLVVGLTMSGKQYCKTIHRLLAVAFIPNPENKPTVNHKDGNKMNNSLENLEWATFSEQVLHACKNGLFLTRGKIVILPDGVPEAILYLKSLGYKPSFISKLFNCNKDQVKHVFYRYTYRNTKESSWYLEENPHLQKQIE